MLTGVLHALCNAHHLRELRALIEIEKEVWASKMRCLLRRACHAANLARKQDAPLSPRLIALVERRYDAIVTEGVAFHEVQPALACTAGINIRRGRKLPRVGHNLLLRLNGRKQDVLRFLFDPAIPFTNTVPERDVRMMKTRQKILGGFRSVLSTARKQGWNMLRTLATNSASLIADQQVS